MKRISLLKALVTIALAISIIILFFGIPFTAIYLVAPQMIPNSIRINIGKNNITGAIAFMYLLFSLGSYTLYAYSLYNFREALKLFEKRVFFSNNTAAFLRKTGMCLLVACLLMLSAEITAIAFAPSIPHTTTEFTFEPAAITATLALLFVVLGDVFTLAKNINEENDFTV